MGDSDSSWPLVYDSLNSSRFEDKGNKILNLEPVFADAALRRCSGSSWTIRQSRDRRDIPQKSEHRGTKEDKREKIVLAS